MEPLWSLPARALAALVAGRVVSARSAAEAALARIEAVNPALNAVVDLFAEETLAEADAVDRAIAAGIAPGPLAGVPVTVKVMTDQRGRASTNGLRLDADKIAEADHPVVANLRRAGAVIVGRTNTPAFSVRWFTRNALHGATLNPHDCGLTPGGSSGGAASAVAAGIGAIAHGTDIAGSVRYPAYACGVHGLRPTLGRVPTTNPGAPPRPIGGQIMATHGPLARRVDDLRLALAAMAPGAPEEAWWAPAPLAGPSLPRRVALCRGLGGVAVAPGVLDALDAAAAALEAAGWRVEEADPGGWAEAAEINLALWMADLAATGLPRLDAAADPDASLVVPGLRAIVADGPGVEDALARRMGLVARWQVFLAERPLVLCPVSAEPPFPDHLDVESPDALARCVAAQRPQMAIPALGLPALTVATGRPGRPMGVQLVAPRFREDLLLDAGAAIEAAHPPIAPVEPFAAG